MSTSAASAAALHSVFSYATDNFAVLDDALLPSATAIAELDARLQEGGIEALQPQDADTVLDLVVGLRQLSATEVPGYYSRDQFELTAALGRSLAGGP